MQHRATIGLAGAPLPQPGVRRAPDEASRLRERLAECERDLAAARDELYQVRLAGEREAEVRAAFLANMSHEIRTPMNGVIGALTLLSGSPLDDEQRSLLDLARKSAESLLGIVNDVLDLSRIDAGRLTLERVPFDLVEMITTVTQLLELRAREKGIAVELHIAEGVPRWVSGDPVRLRQVLNNLISNAVKFTDRGRVDVTLTLAAVAGGEAILGLTVRDTGIGIPADQLETVFLYFRQADASMTRKYGGSGLGLAIARRIVRLMNGDISVSSAPGYGSEFMVSLALGLASAPVASEPVTAVSDAPGPRRRRVLLAEDDRVNRRIAVAFLKLRGHDVDVAEDGGAAVARARAGRYDVVLMDIQMPVLDGYEATRAIRAAPGGDAPRIVGLTANAMQGERERCVEAGMDDYLAKPFKPEALFRVVEDPALVAA